MVSLASIAKVLLIKAFPSFTVYMAENLGECESGELRVDSNEH
jgi:hypothetical protein